MLRKSLLALLLLALPTDCLTAQVRERQRLSPRNATEGARIVATTTPSCALAETPPLRSGNRILLADFQGAECPLTFAPLRPIDYELGALAAGRWRVDSFTFGVNDLGSPLDPPSFEGFETAQEFIVTRGTVYPLHGSPVASEDFLLKVSGPFDSCVPAVASIEIAESQPPVLQVTIEDVPVAECPPIAPDQANQVLVPIPGLPLIGPYEVEVRRSSSDSSLPDELFATTSLRALAATDPRVVDLEIEPTSDPRNPGYDVISSIEIPGPCPSWALELAEVEVVGRDIELYFDALATPAVCGSPDVIDSRRETLGDLDSGEYRIVAYLDIDGAISPEPAAFWAQSDQLITLQKRSERLGNANRFRITLDWQDYEGRTGTGFPVAGNRSANGNEGSAVFAFFSQDNWELIVKVLNGCGFNGHFWVFGSASTDVAYTLTVEDTETGAIWSFDNELGTASPAITDTSAFPCQQR